MVRGRRAAEALTVDGLRDRLERPRASAPGCSATRSRQGRPRRKPSCASARAGASWTPELERGGTAPRRRRPTSLDRQTPTRKAALMDTAEIRRRFVAHFESRAATPAVPSALAAARRPEPAVRQRRHGAVQALLPRPGDAAVRPRGQRAEVRAHPRHRGRRQDHPARHVLRDVRQLLLRRLLQGGRHRARLGPGHQAAAPTAAAASRRAGSTRASTTTTPRRSSSGRRSPACPTSGSCGSARRRTTGRWACPARAARARRSSTTAARTYGAPSGGHAGSRGPLPRVLEPRLHAGRAAARCAQGRLRHRRPAAEAEHRHRHGPRAGRVPAAGQGQHVRDRRDVPGDRAGRGAHRPPVRRATTRTTSGSGSSPTTSAAR